MHLPASAALARIVHPHVEPVYVEDGAIAVSGSGIVAVLLLWTLPTDVFAAAPSATLAALLWQVLTWLIALFGFLRDFGGLRPPAFVLAIVTALSAAATPSVG